MPTRGGSQRLERFEVEVKLRGGQMKDIGDGAMHPALG